jgi:hypothetical protein
MLTKTKLVTISGECIEIDFSKPVRASEEGTLYFFEVTDLSKNRGSRRVALFVSDTDQISIEDYPQEQQEAIFVNAIRRGFDSGDLSFEGLTPSGYKQLPLRKIDLQPRNPASDHEIRQFIRHAAYWLSYRNTPEGSWPIPFDTFNDLQYLGVGEDEVRRIARLMERQGWLERSMVPGSGRPTPKLIEEYESMMAASKSDSAGNVEPPVKIFLGHGRNALWARTHMHLQNDLGLKVEAWESESRVGRHAVDVLKKALESCAFAVIVVTAEDKTSDGEVRARQNVVHEIGLFQGRLGFEKVALLQQEGVEEFSNLAGLQVIKFSDGQIEAGFYELDRVMKREGIIK